jgi:hypothetical protein
MRKRGFNPQDDYLKYWRVIRYYVKAKYNINQAELDILLFLYSEKYFTKDKFEEFDTLLSWDENRFDNLLRDGWIIKFRPYNQKTKEKALYEISYKGKRLVSSIYKKLGGEELPSSSTNNPLFAKNVSYSDKRYREFIKEMNAYVRQQRHRAPE